MVSPSTTALPRPRSWDEFEDICADILKRLWQDPYVVRNGRSGQAQNGVDSYGNPAHLGGAASGKIAGAQCKRVDDLPLATVKGEVAEAEKFEPKLSEYLIMTTAPRDAKLQAEVRKATWPFPVHVYFWEDISLELSGHEDLLKKHFPGWFQRTTSRDDVLRRLYGSAPEDFDYNDTLGIYTHRDDLNFRIVLERGEESDREFVEPWVEKFPDKRATRQPVYVQYGDSRVETIHCAYVDGARYLIPYPQSAADPRLSRSRYHIGRILNHPIPGYGLDFALKRAGIVVVPDDDLASSG